jgi:lipopolysaccharide export system protein LptA
MLATVGAIVIATALYAWMQPSTRQHESVVQQLSAAPPPTEPPPTTSDSSTVVQSGEDVWVKVPDAKTGQLSWQFRASRYDPQPDGSINVTKPQAEFFFAGGQIVSLRGTHGHVVMSGDMTKTGDMHGPTSPPSRGEMYDVTISLYHAINMRHPVLVCKMNNISFDNDTYRIATENFTDPNGNVVPADQVPVTVRGDDYDFDGRGLVIRWDDRDHRLQSLEIAHGDELVVKSQEALKGVTPASDTTTVQPATPTAKPAAARPKSAAGKKKSAATPAATPTPTAVTPTTKPTTQKADAPVYRATFNGGVRVTQNNLPLAIADTMRIDFKSQNEDESNSTEPSAPPQSSSATPARKSSAASSPKVAAKSSAATAPPTTQQSPVIVRWPGKLVVVPIETDIPKLAPGQRNIEMISTDTPVVLNRTGSEVHCASFLYQGGDDSIDIRSSPAVPIITMKDSTGGMLYTPSMKYNGTEQKAYLDGPSHAEVPMQDQQGGASGILNAKWSQHCVLTMAGPSRDQLQIKNAKLVGDVDVDHPKLKLKSDALDIGFEPSSTPTPSTDSNKTGNAQVKDLTAFGNVRCETIDQDQKKRHIDSDHLVVTTEKSADGQLVPRTLVADGHVHTFDEEQDLRSGYLYAKLAPATQPSESAQVQNLFAQQNVQFAFKDTTGHCDQLTADADGDDYDVKLVGQPNATVVSKDSTLNGPIINLQPKRQNVQVVGAGTMHGVQQQTAQSKATPFDVAWDSELNFNGSTNLGDAASNVVVKTISADGTVNTATGDKLTMELMDEPGSTTKPTTRPTANSNSPMDFDTGNKKQLKAMNIVGNAEVKSILSSSSGNLLRRTHLFAPLVRVEAADKKMIVPAAGRMLYEDLRATTQPSPSAAATESASPLGDMSGQTAFQWDRNLTYDQSQDRAEMVGNVIVVHQDSSGRGEPFRLDSERVVVEFQPTGEKPTTQPSDAKVKAMDAEGAVQFVSRQIRFESDRMSFDTINNLLTAYGTEHQPVEIYDENGVSSAIVQKAWWDTRTQQLGMRDISANMRK